jgi:hypothetical protein
MSNMCSSRPVTFDIISFFWGWNGLRDYFPLTVGFCYCCSNIANVLRSV